MHIELETYSGVLKGEISKGNRMSTRGVLLLHPHPLYGGNMNNNVILAIDEVIREFGVSTLRFDFRGPNSSLGQYEGPRGAVEDASIMIEYMKTKMGVKDLAIIGYSFGGSVALGVSTHHLPSFL
ncbi:MAG: hypothetical protein P1Q69_18105, partial [Candidatus Thorarchaeota archaeon]|nr:hypothetical protein [Candidatus Thorarchaeota archaeon]